MLEKFVRINGVHMGTRQIVLTEELFTDSE